jgi:hypothetical protein
LDGICSAVKTVVFTVVSVLMTAIAVLKTLFIYARGDKQRVGEIWSEVGKEWKKTGK